MKGVEKEFLELGNRRNHRDALSSDKDRAKRGPENCYSRRSVRRGKNVFGTPETTGRHSTWKCPL